MGKSLRSKRMRENRNRKREVNRPKELKKLKEALTFEYNDETETAHVSMFSDIVNGPLPPDYFEPSKTILEERQEKYEKFLSRKIPKIAEIASRNLVRPMADPEKKEKEEDSDMESNSEAGDTKSHRERDGKKSSKETIVKDSGDGCKPSRSGSWPVWMNHRKIKAMALRRRKIIKRSVKRHRRMNKAKYIEEKKKKMSQSENVENMET